MLRGWLAKVHYFDTADYHRNWGLKVSTKLEVRSTLGRSLPSLPGFSDPKGGHRPGVLRTLKTPFNLAHHKFFFYSMLDNQASFRRYRFYYCIKASGALFKPDELVLFIQAGKVRIVYFVKAMVVKAPEIFIDYLAEFRGQLNRVKLFTSNLSQRNCMRKAGKTCLININTYSYHGPQPVADR